MVCLPAVGIWKRKLRGHTNHSHDRHHLPPSFSTKLVWSILSKARICLSVVLASGTRQDILVVLIDGNTVTAPDATVWGDRRGERLIIRCLYFQVGDTETLCSLLFSIRPLSHTISQDGRSRFQLFRWPLRRHPCCKARQRRTDRKCPSHNTIEI